MGKVIVVGTVITLLTVGLYFLVFWWARQNHRQAALRTGLPARGDLNKTTENELIKLAQDAASIMTRLTSPPSDLADEFDLLSTKTDTMARAWLDTYTNLARRVPRQ